MADEALREQVPGTDSGDLSTSRPVWTDWFKPSVIVAIVVLIAFLFTFRFMVVQVGNGDEVRWMRLVYLYGSVEAIVFAAVGAIFGTSVTRQQAEGAGRQLRATEKRLDLVQRDKENYLKDAANGRALAEAAKASASSAQQQAARGGSSGSAYQDAAESGLLILQRQAEELFPDR